MSHCRATWALKDNESYVPWALNTLYEPYRLADVEVDLPATTIDVTAPTNDLVAFFLLFCAAFIAASIIRHHPAIY